MIGAVASLLVVEAIGAAALVLLCSDPRRWTWPARLGLGFMLGLVALSVWLFLASLAGLRPAWWLGLVELALLGIAAIVVRRDGWPRWLEAPTAPPPRPRGRGPRALDAVLVVFVVGLCALVGAVALAEPLVEWDALAIWGFKARVLLQEPISASTYFTDLSRAYSHLDYPLLWPLAMTWVWAWVGRADLDAVKVLAPALLGAIAATGHGLLRRRHDPTTALVFTAVLVGLPMTLSQTARLAADAPLACFTLAAFSCWYLWLVEDDIDALRVSGVLAGGMALTKNEGLGLLAVLLVLTATAVVWPWRPKRARQAVVWTALTPLIVAGSWLLFRARIPKVHEDYGSRIHPAIFLGSLERVPEVLRQSLTYFGDVSSWLVFWPLLAIGLLLTIRRWWRRPLLLLVLAVVLPVLMYGYVFVVTPWTLDDLMDLSANRVLFHVAPLGVLLLAEVLRSAGFLAWTERAAPGPPPRRSGRSARATLAPPRR
jgi:hypothetical protein